MVEIGKKIAQIRSESGKTQQELADFLGVDVKKVGRIERGETKSVKNNDLRLIANFFNLPLSVLLDSKMSVSPVSKLSVSNNQNVSKSNSVPQSFLNRSSIKNVPQSDSTTHTPHQKSSIIQIPIYDDVVASAGGGVINDEYPTQSVGIDKGFLRTHFGLSSFLGLSIITAKGDSMSPTIPENCQLLVQKSVPKEGQICVVRIDDELYVKRLQKLPKYRLISDNKSYENIELEGREYDIVGVVVGFFKRMI
ncbi:S24 family peptidase [Helicobacter typhlonius]|uniref:XRE family transcriptional regulator n=2 Tax=Helicobacter TaxID=209 RepID=UPI0026127BCD|nr:S24 family peptidase [uncultured Helicobacter sp.]